MQLKVWLIDWVVKGEHSTESGKAIVIAENMISAIHKLDVSGRANDLKLENIVHCYEIVDNITIVKQAGDIPF
jgi:hypothetical protein